MFRFDCTFSNFNCTKRVQLHTILRPGETPDSLVTVRRQQTVDQHTVRSRSVWNGRYTAKNFTLLINAGPPTVLDFGVVNRT